MAKEKLLFQATQIVSILQGAQVQSSARRGVASSSSTQSPEAGKATQHNTAVDGGRTHVLDDQPALLQSCTCLLLIFNNQLCMALIRETHVLVAIR